MKSVAQKIFITFGCITLIMLSVIPVFVDAQTTASTVSTQLANTAGKVGGVILAPVLFPIIGSLYIFMSVVAALLGFSGLILDGIINLTIVDLSKNINAIAAINGTWKVIRDLANMSFIFILLYEGIRMVLGLGGTGVKKVVSGIIMSAILVNFSLFFTKVIIDASNIITLGFYKSIVSSGTGASGITTGLNAGLTGAYMSALKISSLYAPGSALETIFSGLPGVFILSANSIFLLIAVFIFLSITVMFVIRYIAFILLLIMSPVYFASMAIPGLSGLKDKFLQTLISQSLFGPVFMLLTWVMLTLAGDTNFLNLSPTQTLVGALTDPGKDTISVIINYIIIIGLLIQTLVLSKSVATKGGYVTSKIIDKGQSYLGGAVFGGAAWAGRSTAGRFATKIADDKDLQRKADMGDRGARLKLAAAQFGAKSSFDVRNTKVVDKITGEVGTFGKGMPWNNKVGEGGYKGSQKTTKDKGRGNLDEVVERYRKTKDWATVAEFISKQKPADQSYIYEKLSPRDRIAVDEALDTQYRTTGYTNPVSTLVRGKLTLEEREKTEEAGKKAAKVKKDTDLVTLIEGLVVGTPAINPATVTPTTPAGVPYTYDDLLLGAGRNVFSPKNARNLSIAALNDPNIIRRLKPQHLADIMANNDELDDATIRNIVSVVEAGYVTPAGGGTATPPATTYTYQKAQYAYINKAANSDNWHI